MPSQSETQVLASELRTVLTRLIKKLRSQSSARESLSLTERAVIKLLDQHQQLLPSELAVREKVTTQSMSQILNHLSLLGYIMRRPSPTDKRKVLISLTMAGREILPTVRQEVDEWLHKALLETCSAEELASLNKALPILAKLVEL